MRKKITEWDVTTIESFTDQYSIDSDIPCNSAVSCKAEYAYLFPRFIRTFLHL